VGCLFSGDIVCISCKNVNCEQRVVQSVFVVLFKELMLSAVNVLICHPCLLMLIQWYLNSLPCNFVHC